MLWGAAEIALAQEALGGPPARVKADLAAAAHWAHAYLAQGHGPGGDTLNLYDTGAIGDAELLQAMRQPGAGQVIAPAALLGDMAAQLKLGEHAASGDPFALGTALGDSDATPHAFGLYITDALYRKYGGGPAPTRPSPASSWPTRSAPTRGGRRSSSGRAARSRTACRAR